MKNKIITTFHLYECSKKSKHKNWKYVKEISKIRNRPNEDEVDRIILNYKNPLNYEFKITRVLHLIKEELWSNVTVTKSCQ